jgi:hypothetical protein
MKFDYESSFRKAVKGVGRKAFHTIYKSLSDGLPPDNELGNSLWKTDLVSNDLSEADTKKVARLALDIEEEAFQSILRLLLTPDFLAYFKEDTVGSNARRLFKERKKRRTEVYEAYLENNMFKSSKQILREMESEGLIEQEGDFYLTVQEDLPRDKWPRTRVSSMPAKLSRIRRQLRNA